MIVRALLAVAQALPPGAHAPEWVRGETGDQHQHFYDRTKVAVEEDSVTFWRRVVFRSPQAVRGGQARMAMYRDSIDCSKHTLRSLGYLLYGQDGAVLENVYTPDAQADPIIPETVGDRFEALMCVFVDQAQVSKARARSELPEQASVSEIRAQVERLEAELEALGARLRTASTDTPAPPAERAPQ